uniref:Uncharacterized protein n=1 Tax=Anas platyrhynchos TaxID=8839 RepID=A0A8B9ST77_ANAPL
MPPRWASLLLLGCCLVLLAGHPATDLVRFYNDLQQYLNVVTRHRYGRRSSSRGLCEDPMGAAGC